MHNNFWPCGELPTNIRELSFRVFLDKNTYNSWNRFLSISEAKISRRCGTYLIDMFSWRRTINAVITFKSKEECPKRGFYTENLKCSNHYSRGLCRRGSSYLNHISWCSVAGQDSFCVQKSKDVTVLALLDSGASGHNPISLHRSWKCISDFGAIFAFTICHFQIINCGAVPLLEVPKASILLIIRDLE